MIHLEQATVRYGARVVLNEADFHLSAGQFAYLTGKSGAGKSTVLKLVYGEVLAAGGEVRVAGRETRRWKKHELRRQFGVIFQSYELLPGKTVRENIRLAALVRGMHHDQTEREISRLLDRVGLLDRAQAYPHLLSGGEQQRVAVVRALVGQPRLILADEPTGNLDQETADDVMELLIELQREAQFALLVVTHDRGLMARFPAAVWEVAEGKVRLK